MTAFDQFERGLAAALRADADESISPYNAAAIARAAIASHRRRTLRVPRSASRMRHARFAVAAAVAVAVIAGAFRLFGPNQNAIGPSGPPEPSPSAPSSASQAPTAASASARPGTGAWSETGSMGIARAEAYSITLLRDGRVLVTGGAGFDSRSAEIYDPTEGSWSPTSSMAQLRLAGHSATLLPDGTVLVAGGDGAARSAELFDPVAGTWTATGRMTQSRTTHAAVLLLDGTVLVVGGGDDRRSAEVYDPVDGTWTPAGSMTQARDGFTTTRLRDGRLLVAGGFDQDRLASVELYDPVERTWASLPPMPEPYLAHTATLLPNGTVLVAGGDAPSGPGAGGHAHAALYDPATRSWTDAQDMLLARWAHTATQLSGGEVLVAGGRVHSGLDSEAFDDAELYDPATGMWTLAAGMHSARSGHAAVLLADDRLLIIGGYASDGEATGSAEIFELASP